MPAQDQQVKTNFFSRNPLLLALCLFFLVLFLVEFLYMRQLKFELAERERKVEESLASQEEEKVVTPAMLREELSN